MSGDSVLGQLILAKLVNKLPRFYKIQWIIAKKTAFGRNTQYHEAWQSQISAWEQYRCWNFRLSNRCSWGLRLPRCLCFSVSGLHDGCWSSDGLLSSHIMENVCPDASEERAASVIKMPVFCLGGNWNKLILPQSHDTQFLNHSP
jgi:hypothetical protein